MGAFVNFVVSLFFDTAGEGSGPGTRLVLGSGSYFPTTFAGKKYLVIFRPPCFCDLQLGLRTHGPAHLVTIGVVPRTVQIGLWWGETFSVNPYSTKSQYSFWSWTNLRLWAHESAHLVAPDLSAIDLFAVTGWTKETNV